MDDSDDLRPRHHFIHRWTKWKEKSYEVRTIIGMSDRVILVRTCVACGYVQARRILVT
jgi:hypothetical protein